VDYWALGVLFYEMLNGCSPFEAEDHLATYRKVLEGTVTYPQGMDTDAADLIGRLLQKHVSTPNPNPNPTPNPNPHPKPGKLLQKDISRRYGNLREGARDVKDHAFFRGAQFPWEDAFGLRGSIRPDGFDPSTFEWFAAEQLVTETKPCRKDDQALFYGF
jgi:serine/threonine protein kinase